MTIHAEDDATPALDDARVTKLPVVIKHSGRTHPMYVVQTATAFGFKESIYQLTGVPPGMSHGILTVPGLAQALL